MEIVIVHFIVVRNVVTIWAIGQCLFNKESSSLRCGIELLFGFFLVFGGARVGDGVKWLILSIFVLCFPSLHTSAAVLKVCPAGFPETLSWGLQSENFLKILRFYLPFPSSFLMSGVFQRLPDGWYLIQSNTEGNTRLWLSSIKPGIKEICTLINK